MKSKKVLYGIGYGIAIVIILQVFFLFKLSRLPWDGLDANIEQALETGSLAPVDTISPIQETTGSVVITTGDRGEVSTGDVISSGDRQPVNSGNILSTGDSATGMIIPSTGSTTLTGSQGSGGSANSGQQLSWQQRFQNFINASSGYTAPTGHNNEGPHIVPDTNTGSLQIPVDPEASVTPPSTPFVPSRPTESVSVGGGGGGGGTRLMPDDCSVDLSPSYYDKSCDAPEELQPITPSSGLRVVINTITPVSDSPISVCYYKDGKFSPSNYKDIAGSRYETAIRKLIDTCMIHGSADTETYYNPQEFINKGEFIKIVVRAHKLLPSSFNHFDRANNGFNYRRTPYISAAISEFPSLREVFALWPDRSMYDAVSKNDIRAVLQTINPTLFGSVDLMGKIGLSRGAFAQLINTAY